VTALRAANIQVAAGSINQPPATSPGAFEVAVQTLGRLSSPDQFSEIVVATDQDGRVTRVRDIGRVELGSQDYTTNAYLDLKVATAIGIFQRPGSNALATAAAVLGTMEELAKSGGVLGGEGLKPSSAGARSGNRLLMRFLIGLVDSCRAECEEVSWFGFH
jgi:HAE1 family hydrophobic/amphiphilic exporter-1